MLEEARRFAAWHPNVVVKVPSTPNGWAAVKQLKQEDIRTNVTLCFSANQALFAALAGAYIISPFVGRLDDISEEGLQVVRETAEIYRQHHLSTLVLAASIRRPRAHHRRGQSRRGYRDGALQGTGDRRQASAHRQGDRELPEGLGEVPGALKHAELPGPPWRASSRRTMWPSALSGRMLWRRASFGSDSEVGSRFAERLLTVVASCRQQGRALLAFLVAMGQAALQGSAPPSLLSARQGD